MNVGQPWTVDPVERWYRIDVAIPPTGSSFPADSAKPVPFAVVSLDSR